MKGVLKINLPQKICISCGLPFTWRKNGNVIGIMSSIVVKNAKEKKNCFNLVKK